MPLEAGNALPCIPTRLLVLVGTEHENYKVCTQLETTPNTLPCSLPNWKAYDGTVA